MTELLVIRHGETDYNRELRFQGQIDVPLNAAGLIQAARLAERLAHEPLDALWTSDLARARATAQPLAAALDFEARSEPLWREQAFGLLEGMDAPTVRREHGALWARWARHEADYALPGGESARAFYARVMRALAAVVAAHPDQRVAIVTHGGVLDMLWRSAHGASLDGPRAVEIPNTGLNLLRWRAGVLDILRWADARHLDGLPVQPTLRPRRADQTGED